MKFNKIKKLIFKQFDSTLSKAEKSDLENALAKSSKMRKEENDILKIRKLVSNSAVTSFNPFFEMHVMNKIRYENISYINSEILFEALIFQFRKFTFSVLLLTTFLISINLSSGEKFTLNRALDIPEVRIEDILNPTINFWSY